MSCLWESTLSKFLHACTNLTETFYQLSLWLPDTNEHTHTNAHTCMCANACVHICTHTSTPMHAFRLTWMFAYIRAHIYTCTPSQHMHHTHTHTHTHTHIHTSPFPHMHPPTHSNTLPTPIPYTCTLPPAPPYTLQYTYPTSIPHTHALPPTPTTHKHSPSHAIPPPPPPTNRAASPGASHQCCVSCWTWQEQRQQGGEHPADWLLVAGCGLIPPASESCGLPSGGTRSTRCRQCSEAGPGKCEGTPLPRTGVQCLVQSEPPANKYCIHIGQSYQNAKTWGCTCCWSLSTSYLLACQVRVTLGDSGLCCCDCVTSFEC